ncbi:aminoglycoside 3-N-acetyltransferase I [Dinghuibacter silviterrae]|uniref:Aminoglycoside 3-N-acetyltransferase I n=2 Tax=Dinghuibacter silviterrae TaxID=1539049 RepID=A0A4R8DXQ7_9BACT|nr:aminoglycoside 3-N-acetyltransferase I [Dinghuibacter silviterrae]
MLSARDLSMFSDLLEVLAEAFGGPFGGSTGSAALLGKPHFLAVVALDGLRVVGGLTSYMLESYTSSRPLLYVYDLAVASAYRRQGIGTGLIRFITAYGRENGFEEIFVQAHRADSYALDFYRRAGATSEEDVVQFSFSL